jgi:hypothetical protein
MSDKNALWLSRDGQKYGPYTEAQVRAWYEQGQLPADSMVWRAGTANWMSPEQMFNARPSAGAAFQQSAGPSASHHTSQTQSPGPHASSRESAPKGNATMTISLSFVTVLIIGALLAIWFVPSAGIGAELKSDCKINGLGNGSCQFTNVGWTPGSACVAVKIVNTNGTAVSSSELCSGRVSPSDTVTKEVNLVLNEGCEAQDRAWNEVCHLEVDNE